LVLPRYLEVLRSIVFSENHFVSMATESVQTLFKLTIFECYTNGVIQAFNEGLLGDIKELKSTDGCIMLDEIETVHNESQRYRDVGCRTVTALLNLYEPTDIGLIGNKGIRNMSHLLVSGNQIPMNIAERWQYYNAQPTTEIPIDLWIKTCMPEIAAEHIIAISNDGEIVSTHLGTFGLRPNDYEKMGLA
jgi:hypothetical protein